MMGDAQFRDFEQPRMDFKTGKKKIDL